MWQLVTKTTTAEQIDVHSSDMQCMMIHFTDHYDTGTVLYRDIEYICILCKHDSVLMGPQS